MGVVIKVWYKYILFILIVVLNNLWGMLKLIMILCKFLYFFEIMFVCYVVL